jgi:hypothetical protein
MDYALLAVHFRNADMEMLTRIAFHRNVHERRGFCIRLCLE